MLDPSAPPSYLPLERVCIIIRRENEDTMMIMVMMTTRRQLPHIVDYPFNYQTNPPIILLHRGRKVKGWAESGQAKKCRLSLCVCVCPLSKKGGSGMGTQLWNNLEENIFTRNISFRNFLELAEEPWRRLIKGLSLSLNNPKEDRVFPTSATPKKVEKIV